MNTVWNVPNRLVKNAIHNFLSRQISVKIVQPACLPATRATISINVPNVSTKIIFWKINLATIVQLLMPIVCLVQLETTALLV